MIGSDESRSARAQGPRPELSVVIPCLNEAETLEVCVRNAQLAMRSAGIDGEIVVADNGSTDDSANIAGRLGARVVPVAARGYGAALMGGIDASSGRFILMADADASYDLGELPRFLAKLREGHDLVQGCRLPSGGGHVAPGAMPFLHRWVGNPMFSMLARRWFRAPIHDVHCGMRAFTRELYDRLGQVCTGMEFASENIVKASLAGARIAEVPITLHPDGRTLHAPHLRTFRDGWRHLRFYLLYSPRWLFLVPGAAAGALGLLGYAVALPGLRVGGVSFDVHTLLVASLLLILGYQSILFAVLSKVFGVTTGLLPPDPRLDQLFRRITLEVGLAIGIVLGAAGLVLIAWATFGWYRSGFGPIDYRATMRWVIPGVTLSAIGVQTVFSSFFLSLLGLRRR